MKINDFQTAIAHREGKEKQTHIGNIREVIKVIDGLVSIIDQEDLIKIAKNYNGENLLKKIIRKL